MNNDPLRFKFYGVTLSVRCGHPEINSQIRNDFFHFLTGQDHEIPAAIQLEFFCEPQPLGRNPHAKRLWSSPRYSVHDADRERWVDYNGQALCRYDFSCETGTLWCPDPALMHELAYLLIHSRVGEMLDKEGLHRVHALGFSYRGKAVLALAPMGGGKTTLGMELLRHPGVRIFSDDSPLADSDGILSPLPLRFGVLPSEESLRWVPNGLKRTFDRRRYGRKILVDYGYFKDKISTPRKVDMIFMLKKHDGIPRIRRLGSLRAFFALFTSLVVGHGIPQIREYILRPDPLDMFLLARNGVDRLKTARSLLKHARCYRLRMGPDTGSNARELLRFLVAANG